MSGVIEIPVFCGTVVGTVGSMKIVRGTLHGDFAIDIVENDELVVVLSGPVVFQVNGDCENLGLGDFSLTLKGSEHRVSAADPSLVLIVAG